MPWSKGRKTWRETSKSVPLKDFKRCLAKKETQLQLLKVYIKKSQKTPAQNTTDVVPEGYLLGNYSFPPNDCKAVLIFIY